MVTSPQNKFAANYRTLPRGTTPNWKKVPRRGITRLIVGSLGRLRHLRYQHLTRKETEKLN